MRDNLADSDSPVDSDTKFFRKKSTWTAPPNRDKALDMFLSVVDSEPMNAHEQKPFLTFLLMSVKPCVNLSVILSGKMVGCGYNVTRALHCRGYRQLSDTDVYQQVSNTVFFDVIEEVNDILSRLQRSGVITEDMATYAVPVDSKPALTFLHSLIFF